MADIDVRFEQAFYVLPENSISANLALYVCAAITNIDPRDADNFSENITIGLSTSPGSAQGVYYDIGCCSSSLSESAVALSI